MGGGTVCRTCFRRFPFRKLEYGLRSRRSRLGAEDQFWLSSTLQPELEPKKAKGGAACWSHASPSPPHFTVVLVSRKSRLRRRPLVLPSPGQKRTASSPASIL